MAKLSKAPYKGSRDFYPADMRKRQWMFEKLSSVCESYGFNKIDAPLIEPIDLYLVKTSEEIVNQQIYSFTDRGGRKVAIRPEMTPTVSRMVGAKIRELTKPIRWYCTPNLWRYEKPGKGRLREHWQLNADIFAASNEFEADVEILILAIDIMQSYGSNNNHFSIRINHRDILNDFLGKVLNLKEELWQPISRLLDKKEKLSKDDFIKLLQAEGLSIKQIEFVERYMNEGFKFLTTDLQLSQSSGTTYLSNLLQRMKSLNLEDYVSYDPTIVRGFDYYTGFIFEVYDKHPDNNRSLFGGGRYNNLVANFTNDEVNAVGFGMGDVTLENFLEVHNLIPRTEELCDIYIASFDGVEINAKAIEIAKVLRKQNFTVIRNINNSKIQKQFQEANNRNAKYVITVGETEIQNSTYNIKNMKDSSQEKINEAELIKYFTERL